MNAESALQSIALLWPVLVLAWPCLYVTMAVHESGHALMHVLLGGSIRELHFGGTTWRLCRKVRFGLRPWTGRAVYEEAPRLSRGRRAVVTASGPLANLLVGLLTFAWAQPAANTLACEFAGMSVAAGALNLLPVLRFDGRRLLSLWMSHRAMRIGQRVLVAKRVELVTLVLLACVGVAALLSV